MSVPLPIRVMQLPHAEGLPLPQMQTEGAAGADLIAALQIDEQITIKKSERALVPTGLVLQLPTGFEAQIRPRSGLAYRHGVTVLNAPGTIDADYRGEIKVLLVNFGDEPFVVTRGLRMAQIVVAPVVHVTWTQATELDETLRGAGGFGSTGMTGSDVT
jgi:dUTP pyrophosphatase